VSEERDDARDQKVAELLARALSGEDIPGPAEPADREVTEALSAAAFLRDLTKAPLLSPEALFALGGEIEWEARLRARRRRRTAVFGIATLLAAAASLVLVFGAGLTGREPSPYEDARFPAPPVLKAEIAPGSSPLSRLDPVYEAGLRGYREARFLGARHAYAVVR